MATMNDTYRKIISEHRKEQEKFLSSLIGLSYDVANLQLKQKIKCSYKLLISGKDSNTMEMNIVYIWCELNDQQKITKIWNE